MRRLLGLRCISEGVSFLRLTRFQLLILGTEKYLLALKCLLAAAALDKEHSKVHEQTIRFKLAFDENIKGLSPTSAEVIKTEFTLLPTPVNLAQYNDEYLSKHKDCARRTLSGLKARKMLSPDSAPNIEKDAVAILNLPTITFEEAREGLVLLSTWKSSEIETFRKTAGEKWPKATVFKTST
jgi:N-alpha-acetyltransferase 15/16, NatA auxiliary subunit